MSARSSVPAPPLPDRLVATASVEATRELAARLATVAHPGDVIALFGDLGAGKTQFAKGFASGLGVTGTVNSPSFVLMAEHGGRIPLFHLDLYRLADGVEPLAGGLIDERQSGGVTVIEWAERLGPGLPSERLEVRIGGTGDEPREIRLRAVGAAAGRYLEAVD